MYISEFHISDKIVVYLDLPVGFPGDLILLAHFDALDQSYEGGEVQFLKQCVIPDDGQQFVDALLVLLGSLQLGSELAPAAPVSHVIRPRNDLSV